MAKGDDIQERLIEFAVKIIKLCGSLQTTDAGRHIAGQLLRSGTSPASNYGEARGAESRNDFVHKLGVVLKELNETSIWLEMIKRAGMVSPAISQPLASECDELAKITSSSIRTAGKKQ